MRRIFRPIARLPIGLLTGLALLALSACGAEPEPTGPYVLAAASTRPAMAEAAKAWTAKGNPAPVLTFDETDALARKAALGTPTDIFISADAKWMDWMAHEVALREGSRAELATNRLVLIATKRMDIAFPEKGQWGSAIGEGRIALADPVTVPAGRYGKAALVWIGAWDDVKGRVTETTDAQAAVALVGQGDARLGVVYASDAAAIDAVRIVGPFPDESHAPVRYQVALLDRSRNPGAEPFRAFLLSGEGQAIFARHGFGPPFAADEPEPQWPEGQ